MSEIRYVTVPHAITIEIEHPQGDVMAYVEHLVKSCGLPAQLQAPLLAASNANRVARVERSLLDLVKERTRDTHFAADMDGIMSAVALRNAFAGAEPGQVIGLEVEHWKRLCESLRKPSTTYNAEVMIQVAQHAQAILDAPSTRPEVKLEAVAAE